MKLNTSGFCLLVSVPTSLIIWGKPRAKDLGPRWAQGQVFSNMSRKGRLSCNWFILHTLTHYIYFHIHIITDTELRETSHGCWILLLLVADWSSGPGDAASELHWELQGDRQPTVWCSLVSWSLFREKVFRACQICFFHIVIQRVNFASLQLFLFVIFGRIWKISHPDSGWIAQLHGTGLPLGFPCSLVCCMWLGLHLRHIASWQCDDWFSSVSRINKLIQNHEQAQSSLSLLLSFVVLTSQMSSGPLKWGCWLWSCLHSGVNVLVFLGERHGGAVAIYERWDGMASWFWDDEVRFLSHVRLSCERLMFFCNLNTTIWGR